MTNCNHCSEPVDLYIYPEVFRIPVLYDEDCFYCLNCNYVTFFIKQDHGIVTMKGFIFDDNNNILLEYIDETKHTVWVKSSNRKDYYKGIVISFNETPQNILKRFNAYLKSGILL